jgi:hypothetical protein
MMEQMGEEPDWDKCPVDWEDFPSIIINGINIYNTLGSRIFPDIGYIGKDYTNYKMILNHFGIEKHQEEYLFEIIQFMEQRDIEISQRKLKAEYDRVKRGK